MKSFFKVFIIFGLLLFLQVAHGQTAFTGVASLATGGTGRAAVESNEVGFLNPAAMAHVRGYNIATAYRDFTSATGEGLHNVMIHASESETDTLFPLGITYLKTGNSLPTDHSEIKELHLTSAEKVFKNFSVGLDVARYAYTPANQDQEVHWDGKLGFLYVPKPNLGLGLIFSDVAKSDFYFLKRKIEIGVNYIFDSFFRFDFDAIYPIEDNSDHSSILMAGIEHMANDQLPIRAGFRYDGILNKRYWTAGFGWLGPRIGFDYAFEKNLSKTHDYGHSVDLKVYF